MRFWLIYDKFEAERNKRYIDFYFEKCKEKGIEIYLKIVEDGIELENLPDVAIVRTMNPALSEQLEKMGVRVCNSSFISRIANDKWNTYEYLSEKGIPMPKTYLADEFFSPPFYPMVLKPAAGKGGRDVQIVNNYGEFAEYRSRVKEKAIAQEVVSDKGKDLRVYVVGNKIIKAMLRQSDKDFRSNFCLGGQASVYELSPWETEQVKRVMDCFDISYAGLDFIFHNGKIIFNEMEDVVGARMLYTHTDVDIVEKYINFLTQS